MIADALLINDFQIECDKIKTECPATKIARRGCCALFPNKTWQPSQLPLRIKMLLYGLIIALNARRVASI
jgi:hypothetical protein